MAEASKTETQIEIKPPPPPFFTDLPPENLQEQRVVLSFFKSGHRSRQRRDTWIISVFLIISFVAFLVTMFVNNCWRYSHGDCALKPLGRFSFQPLSENPLLGPSATTLDEMGALRRTFLRDHHQIWRLFASQCLHAGLIHLIINLSSVLLVGIHLEREFGPLRVGIIYLLSAFGGTLVAALFVRNRPAVGSSGALYGLLGAALSELIQNWRMYADKFAALASIFLIFMINLALGLLPYVDNFSSIGGFIAGILLGSVLLCGSQINQEAQNQNKGKGSLFEYNDKSFIKLKLKQKLEWSALRTVFLLLFCLTFAGCLVAVLRGMNMNEYCNLCKYIDCVPTKSWSCEDKVVSCESMVSQSSAELTLTCLRNGNFRVFPYTNISESRMSDICSVICGAR